MRRSAVQTSLREITRWRVLASAAAVSVAALLPGVARAETLVALSDTGNATTNGTNLQAAIDNATLDTRITLPAAATFTRAGGFVLRNKTSGSGYITIESASMSSLPVAGRRVGPTNASLMPNLLNTGTSGSASSSQVISTEAAAHHYRLRGLEISSTTNQWYTSHVQLGHDAQTTLASVPHHIEIDRCYIHAFDDSTWLTRCIRLDSAHTIISGSHIAGAKTNSSNDSQAIGGCNGTGPYYIYNNFLEGAAENILIGGGGTTIPGEIPEDIHVKRNYCFKPLSWKTTPATWSVKNLFEIKFGRRFDIEGNLFENTWAGGQENAIVIKVASNGSSSNPHEEMAVEDVRFDNNKIKHAPTAIMLQGRDWSEARPPNMRRISVRNNLAEDISHVTYGATSGAGGSFMYVNGGPTEVTIDHNTCFQTRYAAALEATATYPLTNFIYRNNITTGNPQHNPDAHVWNNGQIGSAAFATGMSGYVFLKNVIMGVPTTTFNGTDLTQNWFPASWSGVLVSQGGGDYHVVNGSAYDNGGTDGKDVGADIDLVNARTAGCATGTWAAPEIVLYAKDAPTKTSHWTVVADASAAGGSRLQESNDGTAKVVDALPAPASYFEMTFQAQANVPYRLWIRGRAPSNQTASDSVHVQFTNTLNTAAQPAYRIGNTLAHPNRSIEWVLEDGSGTGISAWGFRDSAWGTTVAEKPVIFATSGTQTIRCQRREDGVWIDQIVLSPSLYKGDGPALPNPGEEKNDTTILTKQ